MTKRGFTLVEVVIVLAIISISLGLAGPRIGAGIGRLELNQAVQTVRSFLKFARLQAQRSDRPLFVVLDKEKRSLALVGPDMKVMRQEKIPSSVEFVLAPDRQVISLYVPPSGILRGQPVRLRGRAGEVEVALQ